MMTTPASLTDLQPRHATARPDIFTRIASGIDEMVSTYMELLETCRLEPKKLDHSMSSRAQRMMRSGS